MIKLVEANISIDGKTKRFADSNIDSVLVKIDGYLAGQR